MFMLRSDLTITAHVDCLTLCAKHLMESMHHACIKSGMVIVYTLLIVEVYA